MKADFTFESHGNWENHFHYETENYEELKEQLGKFIEVAKELAELRIKLEKTYHNGVYKTMTATIKEELKK